MSNFSEKLYELRKEKGFSQEELAEKLNVARQTISKWETGITVPDTNNLIEISKIFEISIDELVDQKKEEIVEEDNNKNKNKKKIIKIVLLIIIIASIVTFFGILIYRMVLTFRVANGIVNSHSRDLSFYYHYNEVSIKNGLTDKWDFVNVYRDGDKMVMNYYITKIDNVAANNSPELVRIEYFDKDYYYEIDCIEKTYKKSENNLSQDFYYNLTGLNLDSKLVMELGDISNMKNNIKLALDFDNKFEVSKKTTGDYVITFKSGTDLNNQISCQIIEDEKYPEINLIKTNGEFGIVDYNAYTYGWQVVDIGDEEVAMPDLTGFTLIEE